MDHPLPVVFARKAIELLSGIDVLAQPRWLELRILLANVIPAEACVPRYPPGEQSAAQRTVGQCRNAIAAAVRQDVSLGVALEQIVRRLNRMQRGDATENLHLRDAEVAHADRTD